MPEFDNLMDILNAEETVVDGEHGLVGAWHGGTVFDYYRVEGKEHLSTIRHIETRTSLFGYTDLEERRGEAIEKLEEDVRGYVSSLKHMGTDCRIDEFLE